MNDSVSVEDFVSCLYRGLLNREPDDAGFASWISALQNGTEPEHVINQFLRSPEYSRNLLKHFSSSLQPLPHLNEIIPNRHRTVEGVDGRDRLVFRAADKSDFDELERAIIDHGYYDRAGVWGATIDEDKRVIAEVAIARNATRCLEFGCFNGPVLSVLADHDVEVCGVELSHLAFITAFPNVRSKMHFGDLLEVNLEGQFDVIYCMDILEHLNPNRLDIYAARLRDLLAPDGMLYINSPMFGSDSRFEGFALDLPSWHGQEFFCDLVCDDLGWPQHGHLVWATPSWWEALFNGHGLQRSFEFEEDYYNQHKDYFSRVHGRRTFFALQKN